MKVLIALLILLAAYTIGKRLFTTYEKIEKQQANNQSGNPSPPPTAPATLPGLPASLESSLAAAQSQGATGLGNWLNAYRAHVRDPRLAAIELDYVVLISHQDPNEAKRIFKDVKDRTSPSSPVYDRVKRLDKTFQ